VEVATVAAEEQRSERGSVQRVSLAVGAVPAVAASGGSWLGDGSDARHRQQRCDAARWRRARRAARAATRARPQGKRMKHCFRCGVGSMLNTAHTSAGGP